MLIHKNMYFLNKCYVFDLTEIVLNEFLVTMKLKTTYRIG